MYLIADRGLAGKKISKNNKTLMIYRWSEAETYILMSVLTTLTETHGVL